MKGLIYLISKIMMKSFLSLFIGLISIAAHADGDVLGAAYLCETIPQRLTIVSTEDPSIDDQEAFTSFKSGKSIIHCHVGTKNITANVTVNPPENGQCAGLGDVRVVIFPRKKDGYPIFNDIIFGNSCVGYGIRSLNLKVVIEEKAGTEFITTCSVSDSVAVENKNISCTAVPIAR